MADYRNIIPFIRKAEGGLSSTKNDRASLTPSNCGYGKDGNPYHTNKGIQWSTFVNLASKAGYDDSCENFLNMPDSIWEKIYKTGYWNSIKGDEIQNQAIANTFVEMDWGSGLGNIDGYSGTLPYLRSFFNKNYNKDFTNLQSMIDFVNDLDNQGKSSELFEKLYTFRANKYKALNQPKNLKGWLARLQKFYFVNKPYAISTKEKVVTISGITLLVAGIVIYKIYVRRNN
jgi:hypothetical protein